ncbi:MAG: hypothetical protein JO193_04660 [Candidatus Eremiobacteraeota bacterium]|nr:hypothetical protein [Candidatus Eremiobacteraeota bacterium]MBV9971903.1 hypothetical protein [Candidatus Eremiobacteraeota bacterium]
MRNVLIAAAGIALLAAARPHGTIGSKVFIYNKSDTSIRYTIYRESPKYSYVGCLDPGGSYNDVFLLGAPDWVSIDFYGRKRLNCAGGIDYFKKENFTAPRTEYSANGKAFADHYEYSISVSH